MANKKQEFFPKTHVGNRRGFNIHIQDIRYYGVHQGFKVWVGGFKYPMGRGQFYTTESQSVAIESAINDHLHAAGTSMKGKLIEEDFSLFGGQKQSKASINSRIKYYQEVLGDSHKQDEWADAFNKIQELREKLKGL